jgi:GAF domain-containing protein
MEDKLVGQIALANSIQDFTDRDLEAVNRIAEFYALAIQRKRSDQELKKQIHEINRFNQLMVGREEKMIELKKEVDMLLEKEGKPKKYFN